MRNSNFLYFNSIHELMEELDNSSPIGSREEKSDVRRGSDWCDTDNYQQAHDFMLTGRVYDNLSTDLNKYRTNGCKDKSKSYLSVVGYNVVVPLHLQGVPTCMINNKKTINNKIINIFYNTNVACDVDSEDIVKGTTELMRNIISLEQDGYRVNLYLISANGDDNGYSYIIKLKSDRETLNIKKLCFPLVSSSMLRRIEFRIKERLYKDWIGSGYGLARFDRTLIEKSIQQLTKIPHYEVWNYRGLQFKK